MTDLRDYEAALTDVLSRLEPLTPFAEVLAERTLGESVRVERRSVSVTPQARLSGAIVRAWNGARWVESATSSFGTEGIGRATETLRGLLAKSTDRGAPPGASASTRKEWIDAPAHPMHDVGPEELLKLGRDSLDWATSVPGIREAQVSLAWEDQERLYLNTANARCFERVSRVRASVAPIAIENGRVEFDYLGKGGIGGRERIAFLNETDVVATARSAVGLLSAQAPPTGVMTVLLDPSTSGTFAHESFGHGTEADQFVRDRSYLKPLLGQTLGPELLTIADDGAYPGGWGTIYCDDEGHPGRKTLLVDHGKFVGALHDRETAAAFGTAPTGNTRRADFLSRAFVRMTNTYVEPGDWTLEELVKEAKHGVLLEKATSGIEDPQGGQMQLKVKMGRLIRNGELADRVTSMALSGRVLDVLKACRGASRKEDFEIGPGYCGKGHTDLLPAGTGGSYLLSTAVVGPA